MYAGGCIFVDHATGDVHVEHLLNFTTTETLQAKARYEKCMADMGVMVQAYQADNSIFPPALSKTTLNPAYKTSSSVVLGPTTRMALLSVLFRASFRKPKQFSCMLRFIGQAWWKRICGPWQWTTQCIITTTCLDFLLVCWRLLIFFSRHNPHKHIFMTCMFGDTLATFWTLNYRMGTSYQNGNPGHTVGCSLGFLLIILPWFLLF